MKLKRSYLLLVVMLSIFSGGLKLSFATTIIPLSLEELVQKSTVIAHVKVIGQQVTVDGEASFLVTTLKIVQSYKGNLKKGDLIQIWQWGDGFAHVMGDPVLYPEREGLVFAKFENGRFYLTNLGQAWYDRVVEEGKIIAKEAIQGLTFYKPINPAPTYILWEELISKINKLLQGGSK